ncbi:Hypothetical_protein [Hexamita inflata]|uniref:Hypothetical_protein n=1 Tax=Hexamita inflata TaxID=28002 RepID=A0AA86QZ79_9EUKA|nr:Hypothetical protein HINF_LOCUS51626 [Hexamita inflata]CAI9963984.1 Hypothetical protein HINF_LOCUS51629 [Hexamita inflata]
MNNKNQNESELDHLFLKASALIVNYLTSNQCCVNGTCVTANVMQLSDSDYSRFWVLLETVMRIELCVLKSYFVSTVVPRYMVSSTQSAENCKHEQNSSETSEFAYQPLENPQNTQSTFSLYKQPKCFRSSVPRQKSDQQIQFQNHFSSAVSHLLSVQTGLNVVVSELELCQRLNEHLKSCPKQQFWNQLSELMQIKTARQLSDYYTNSYSKNLHTGQLTTEDKTVLRELNQQMRQMKPAEVAKVFLDKQKTQTYFKRNIVMYVINLRK